MSCPLKSQVHGQEFSMFKFQQNKRLARDGANRQVWRPSRSNITLSLLGISFLVMGMASQFAWSQKIPIDANTVTGLDSNIVTSATFASWFAPLPPAANGVVNPADSLNFSNNPNADFYRWSWQMFLWLTSPAPPSYGGGDRIFNSPAFYDVSAEDSTGRRTFIPHINGRMRSLSVRTAQRGPNDLPVVMVKGQMFEVEEAPKARNSRPVVMNKLGKPVQVAKAQVTKSRQVQLLDSVGRKIVLGKPKIKARIRPERVLQRFTIAKQHIFLDSSGQTVNIEQGQADGGVLISQGGSLIYYETFANDVYAYFRTMEGVSPNLNHQFPKTAADLAAIVNFAALHNKTFPDPNALAVEVKTAWVEASSLPNPTDYITMVARVPEYIITDSGFIWSRTGQMRTVHLALVGLHCVGSVKGHSEMVWSTFEHFGNSPNAAYSYLDGNGVLQAVARDTSPTNLNNGSATSWLFCSNNSTATSGPALPPVVVSNGDVVSNNAFPVGPSDVIRWKPFGAGLNVAPNPFASYPESNTQIISIDHSVLSQLLPGDIRAKYFMTGSTWTGNGVAPVSNFGNPGNTGGNCVGTSQISNTTMESFQQVATGFSASSGNCLSCHVSNRVTVSHVYAALRPLANP
jgi:hypothetical protein